MGVTCIIAFSLVFPFLFFLKKKNIEMSVFQKIRDKLAELNQKETERLEKRRLERELRSKIDEEARKNAREERDEQNNEDK